VRGIEAYSGIPIRLVLFTHVRSRQRGSALEPSVRPTGAQPGFVQKHLVEIDPEIAMEIKKSDSPS
jgi:hypothetical protein